MADSDSDSQSSSSDSAAPSLRRLSKTITRLELSPNHTLELLQRPLKLERKRNPVHYARPNSATLQVHLEDIRPLAAAHTRKNSCDCEACGGERLAKKLQFALLPKSEIPSKEAKIPAIRKLGSMLRSSYRLSTCSRIPGMGLKQSSLVLCEPDTLYTKPPATPALTRYLQHITVNTQPSSPSAHSPLPPIRERCNASKQLLRIPRLTLPARTHMTTPSTSVSEGIGSLSSRSVPTRQVRKGIRVSIRGGAVTDRGDQRTGRRLRRLY